MKIFAPLAGTVLKLESVPDPVFSTYMLGPGIAIDPEGPGVVTVLSPVAGMITSARAHAVFVGPCLVHAGIDTFKSPALTCLVEEGISVDVGSPLITLDMDEIGDLSPLILVAFPGYEKGAWTTRVDPGTLVTPGELLAVCEQTV